MRDSFRILSSKLRKAVAQLPHLTRAVGLMFDVARSWTIAWVLLLIIQGLLPATTVYLTKLIVDGVVAAQRAGGSWVVVRPVVFVVLLLGVAMLLMEIVRSGINYV